MDLSFAVNVPATGLTTGKAPQIAAEELIRATERGLAYMQRPVVQGTPVNLGKLRQAWVTDIYGTDAGVEGKLFNPLIYALPVETGTQPHFPPVAAIEAWVRRKLDVDEKQVRGVAFVIARAIGRRGTRAVNMAKNGFEGSKDYVRVQYGAALARIRERVEGRA